MLNERGDILFPANILAKTLDAAIRDAFRILHATNCDTSSSERFCGFEVWQEPFAP
jgi:hypothetical protein